MVRWRWSMVWNDPGGMFSQCPVRCIATAAKQPTCAQQGMRDVCSSRPRPFQKLCATTVLLGQQQTNKQKWCKTYLLKHTHKVLSRVSKSLSFDKLLPSRYRCGRYLRNRNAFRYPRVGGGTTNSPYGRQTLSSHLSRHAR